LVGGIGEEMWGHGMRIALFPFYENDFVVCGRGLFFWWTTHKTSHKEWREA
jgi:hypothetical protein